MSEENAEGEVFAPLECVELTKLADRAFSQSATYEASDPLLSHALFGLAMAAEVVWDRLTEHAQKVEAVENGMGQVALAIQGIGAVLDLDPQGVRAAVGIVDVTKKRLLQSLKLEVPPEEVIDPGIGADEAPKPPDWVAEVLNEAGEDK